MFLKHVDIRTWDHDFTSFSSGRVIPHGIYDCRRNTGHITIGTSHDTTQFACESFKLWWNKYGKEAYPNASSILVLCDGGGSNSSRYHIFKKDFRDLANEIGV